ncbi:L-lysine permease [Candidatus Burkholderia humilis]|nr:L-lysine permease [Candidatus Burkholderia humilis]
MPNFLLFLAASVAITFAPGPDNLQVLACGVIFHTTLAALGIAALLRSSLMAFQAVKLVGTAYLVWIGIKALRSQGLATAHKRPSQPLSTVFRQSMIGNMLNPKMTLFFIVFLPQFVDPHGAQNVMLQMFELGGVFMLQTVVVFSIFGFCAGMIGAWLDRLTGVTFIALGIKVALRD